MPRDIRWQKTQPPAAGPVGITQNPGTLTCLANQAGGANLATLTAIGGTGVSLVFSVTGNANLTVVGNALKTVASPSFTAGVNQTYTLHVTDTGGSFADPAPRTLSVPAGPSGIISTPSTINSNAALGTLAANLTDTGGTSPFTWAIAVAPDNFSGFLNIASPGATSTLTLNSSGVGNLVGGTPLTGKVIVTDAGGNSFTSSTISVAVNTAATAPTGVNTSPSSLTIRSDQAGGATLATLTEQGGSGSGVTFSVIGNANLTVSGANLNTVASPSFTAGVNQTYFLSVTDSAGTYTDSVARTLAILAAPTGITPNPASMTVLANATANTVVATLAEQGGTGASVSFGVSGNTNLKIVGSNLEVNTSPSFTPGVNQTFALSVTDSGGSFADPAGARTLNIPAGPSAVTLTGNSVSDIAQPGDLVSNITVTGGTPPYAFAYTGGTNTNFNISPTSGTTSSLVVSNTGPGSIGTQSINIQVTDAAGLTATSGATTITVFNHTLSTFVTNFTLSNTGGSTQVSPFTTDIYMAQFAQGAIASGTWPIFKIHGGATLAYSCGVKPRLWADGSIKLLPVAFVIPTGNDIAVNGSLTIDAFTNGTQPAASSRSTSEIPSNFQVEADIVAGGSGTYIANAQDGVTNGFVSTYMDGGAGKVYKIVTDFKQGGVKEGQLQTWFYLFLKNNASGGLAGISANPRVLKPNVDQGGKQMSMFSRLQLKSGGSLVIDPWANSPNATPVTFTATSGSAQYSVPSAGPGIGLFQGTHSAGYGCMVSSTGTLPGGLSANTPYFIRYAGVTNKINFSTQSNLSLSGNGLVTATSAGTPTHTLTPYPYVVFGASIRVLPTTGLWNWVQAGGTVAADCTVRFIPNKTYLHSTRIIPPYDLTIGSFTSTSIIYVMGGCGDPSILQVQGASGERSELGPLNNWAALYFVNQDVGSENRLRVQGLCESHYSNALYMSTTGTIINGLNDTAYTGISQPPSAYGTGSSFRWYYSGATLNTTITDKPTANIEMTFDENETAHIGNYSFAPYVVFGHPDFFDSVMEKACSAVWQRIKALSHSTANDLQGTEGGTANFVVNGTTYIGCAYGTPGNSRADGWGRRDLNFGAGVAPQGGSYDGADHYSMLNDSVDTSYAMILAWRGLLSPTGYARLNGIFGYQNTGRDSLWQHGFNQFADCIAVGLAEKTAPIAIMNDLANCPGHMWDVSNAKGDPWPIRNMTGDHLEVRQNTQVLGAVSDYIDTDDRLGTSNTYQLTFTNGNANIAYTQASTIPGITVVPAVNDIWQFYGQAGVQGTPATPFPYDTPLFIVSVDSVGKTVQLSLTQGGSAIVPTSTTTASPGVLLVGMSFNNPVHSSATSASSDSYMSILAGWLHWHQALGLTVHANLIADLEAQLTWQGGLAGYKPNAVPKYTMGAVF